MKSNRRVKIFAFLAIALVGVSAPATVVPARLRCEYATNPLGIDMNRPRLSWVLEADRRAEIQTAYQILVAGSEEILKADKGDLWDSGRVPSDQSFHVVYQGKLLQSGMRVYWKVRAWDRDGHPSSYSEPAWWEMGLLNPQDWTASWITVDESAEPAADLKLGDWIWNAKVIGEGKAAFFRRIISIDPSPGIAYAVIKINADNEFHLYVNGQFVGQNIFWNMPREYDVTYDLHVGKNVIAVKAINAIDPPGLKVAFRVRYDDGKTIELKSDRQWRTEGLASAGWDQVDFDDSGWEQAVIVPPDKAERWKLIKEKFGPLSSQYVRKEFNVKSPVKRARAYASALGLYELHINGQRVGNDVFTPGWTDYKKRVQYQTYEVTNLLHEGQNSVGAMLGNGWFSGDMGWTQKPPYSQGNLRFILQLDIEYIDGTRQRVVTDKTWHTHRSPITRDTFWQGETYDSRMEISDWSQPGLNLTGWTPAIEIDNPDVKCLVAQRSETIQITQELPAVSMTELAENVYVFDFGRNVAGWVRLKVRGPRGQRIRLRFAEILKSDGHLYRDNLRKAEATDYYILKGAGQEVWEPRFTYHGFRYCEVTGYPGEPTKDALVFRVLHSAAPPTGTFECSNSLINQIWRNITWSQHSNMYSVFTDCPQRDERMGWTGDAVAFTPTACWNMQMARFLTKWMNDITDGQANDGGIPDIAPNIFGSGAGAPGWSDAVIVLPWMVYQFYGDKRIIEENYGFMARWVEYMHGHSKDYLYDRGGYGDWIAPVESPTEPIGSAWCYYSTSLLAKMAAAIGKTQDADKYDQLAGQIAEAFNKKYLDTKTNNYLGSTQTANILPLYFGLVPDQRRSAVANNLVSDIIARNYHLSTGFQGTAYLLPVLTCCGQDELAYKLAAQTSYPSWGYMISAGATTMWELWDADRKGPEMNSRNHAALGSVGRWFFETLAGINIDPQCPGFKKIMIRPTPVGDLTYAGAEYESMFGKIVSKWKIEDGKFKLNVVISPNSTATVFLPTTQRSSVIEGTAPAEESDGVKYLRSEQTRVVYTVGSGQYHFTANMTE